jgi:pimeloyl-ACP methyl ester carboxylesterase
MSTTTLTRGFVQCPDGDIEYAELGSGEPFIMLHMTPASCMWYRDVMPLLADEYRVISMSTMGYGRSSRPKPPYASIDKFATSVGWLLDGLKIDKAHIYGNHTGSQIALEFGALFPDRVKKLMLVEIFNWNKDNRRAVHEKLHAYIPEEEDGGHLIKLWEKYSRYSNKLDWLDFVDYITVNAPQEAYGSMGWEGAGPYCMTRQEVWDNAAKLTAPTLVIHGTTSELGRSHEKFLATIPNASGARLPSTGNFSPPQAPELWAKEIKAFLKK